MEHFLCVIPTLEELEANWDREILEAAAAGDSLENWLLWKQRSLDHYRSGRIIPYFGILDGRVITQAVAHLTPETVQNSAMLVDGQTAYLSAFRTVEAYRGQGWFSRLFTFLCQDLRSRGCRRATLGVEPEERENRAIYAHYGFSEFIKTSEETFPDGSKITVMYYGKPL